MSQGGDDILRPSEMLKCLSARQNQPVNVPIFLLSAIGGLAAGTLAQALTQLTQPHSWPPAVAFLGWSTALWLSIGFLFAWTAARARAFWKAALWGAVAMILYLFCWLFSYCAVFGLCDASGFFSLWRDERIFELASVPVGALIGLVAAGTWRTGLVGSACLAAPTAWSLPEVVRSVAPEWFGVETWGHPRWQTALLLGLPTLLVALTPVLRDRQREVNWPVFLAIVFAGGAVAFVLLRFFNGGMF